MPRDDMARSPARRVLTRRRILRRLTYVIRLIFRKETNMNPTPSATKVKLFTRDVYVVTQWKDDCVYRTQRVGHVMAMMSDLPFKPGSGASLVPKS